MITTTTYDKCYEFRGLSTDTKPTTGVGNGSVFIEMDTLKLWFFDEESKTWIDATAEPNQDSTN